MAENLVLIEETKIHHSFIQKIRIINTTII